MDGCHWMEENMLLFFNIWVSKQKMNSTVVMSRQISFSLK